MIGNCDSVQEAICEVWLRGDPGSTQLAHHSRELATITIWVKLRKGTSNPFQVTEVNVSTFRPMNGYLLLLDLKGCKIHSQRFQRLSRSQNF
jgi:hypothetical protein